MENNIITQFEKIGAKVKINTNDLFRGNEYFNIDVKKVKDEEYFIISKTEEIELTVVNVEKIKKHLILRAKRDERDIRDGMRSQNFLCGFDEKGWFIENTNAPTVKSAIESLKPAAVVKSLIDNKVSKNKRNKRKNKGFKRQGEWFFVPAPDFNILKTDEILKEEPLGDVRSRAHICQFAVRRNAIAIYVNEKYPMGLTNIEYKDLINKNPGKEYKFDVRYMTDEFYVTGYIKHPDHKKVKLNGWYRVFHNKKSDRNHSLNNYFID